MERYKDGKVPTLVTDFWNLLQEPEVLKATLVFATTYTDEIAMAINVAQKQEDPVAVTLADKLTILANTLTQNSKLKTFHPRLETALECVGENDRRKLKAKFVDALSKMHDKFAAWLKQHSDLVKLLGRLRALDPRNIHHLNAPWSEYRDLFGPRISDSDDEDLKNQKVRLEAQLEGAWTRYCKIEKCNIQCTADIAQFWSTYDPVLAQAIAPYLWFPVSSASIERSFSLAGNIDTKNRQAMKPLLREASIVMYCNGDVEGRYTKQ